MNISKGELTTLDLLYRYYLDVNNYPYKIFNSHKPHKNIEPLVEVGLVTIEYGEDVTLIRITDAGIVVCEVMDF